MSEHPLAAYRKANGLTQADIAAALEVTNVTVSRWETGERTPRKRDLRRLSDMTGVPAIEFLRLDEPAE